MRKQFFKEALLAVALAAFSSTAAMGQSTPAESSSEQGKKTELDWLKDVSDRVELHGYAQGGFNYTHQGGEDKGTFELKRILFWANAQITDRWSFLFMHDFSSVVQEFYTDYRFTNNKALTVRLGQFKNGVSLENPLSPTAMEAIDVYSEGVTYLTGCGSDPLMGVQYGRDLGLAIFGETNDGKFRYEAQVMNGQGINKKDGNKEKDFIGRLEYRPVKGLNIVATGQIGRGHAIKESPYIPDIEEGEDYKRNRWTVGFDYKSKAFNVHGEYVEGKDKNTTSRGAYVTGAVPLYKGLDFVGSYDFFNFNTTLGYDQHKVIAGLQYWFFKKCRFQVQYVYKSAGVSAGAFTHDASHAVMAQMQIRLDYAKKK
ncbi:MAG: porin [Prevotella sp.]|nr:porin [Prevotella sp.]